MPNSRYNVIIGRDVLKQGFVFNHAQNTVTWDGLTISMAVATQKPSSITTSFTCAHAAAEVYTNADTTILQAKYDKSSPQEAVDKCVHLNDTNIASLFQLLSKFSRLFSGSLGCYIAIMYKRAGFNYITKLDISMGFYTFELDDIAQKYCVISTLFGLYQYLRLSMGLTNSPDVSSQSCIPCFKIFPK